MLDVPFPVFAQNEVNKAEVCSVARVPFSVVRNTVFAPNELNKLGFESRPLGALPSQRQRA